MATASSIPSLIDTADLARRLGTAGLRVVDASWYLPQTARDARAEYRSGHIPGAVFFDLDTHSDPATSLPHMLPSAESFARGMSGLGLSDEDLIVVYDGSGANLSAARVWWMFRAFGHPQVAVLDGGLGRWQGEGRPLETGDVTPSPGRFHATLDPARVRSLEAVRDAVAAGRAQLVDARSRGRFEGSEPEPRPGLRGGHVPGSRNLPYTELVDADGLVRPPAELRTRFATAGVDLARPIIASCGSGVSACAIALALDRLGCTDVAIYDGSWTEWAARSDTAVATGTPEVGP